MWLMGSPGVFFIERYFLIIKANVLGWPLDDHDIVYLSCICLPRGTQCSSGRWSSNDSSDFSNEPRPVVFGLLLLRWRFCWTSACRTVDIFLYLTLSDECFHLLF